MADEFNDENFWAMKDGFYKPWKTVVDEDGTAHVVAEAKDGRLFAWEAGVGFVEYGDPFTNWVREVREEHGKR